MRVHGDYKIKRRLDCNGQFTKYSDQSCRNFLKEDFFNICGYCGKPMELLKARAQVDHFIPQKFAPDKENEYSNLVYSCQKCNRGKWHYWPTQSIEQSYNDSEGFVDPATDEFDFHLERLDNGEIVGTTEVGKYMVTKMKLDIRPISIIWKVGVLNKKLKTMETIIENKPDDPSSLELYQGYMEATKQLRHSLNLLYEQNESI